MAVKVKREQAPKNITIQKTIVARPVRRTKFDLADWRRALTHAEADNGNRVDLYDLYTDILLDPHLSAQWQKRISNITNTQWNLLVNEKENEEMDGLLRSPQFEEELTYIMETLAWGKTVLEHSLKEIVRYGKREKVLDLYCVKRQHIRPKEGVIVREQYNNAGATSNGIKYREGAYVNYVADLGKDDDLGLLLKAVPYILLKRGDVGDWAQFVQLFGMPFREYRYNGYDDKTYELLKKSAEEMGSAPYIILPDGAQINLHDVKGNGQGAGDVFEKMARYCDEQISVLILGNTETTISSKSSGYAQSETHMKTQVEIYRDDKKYVANWLNEKIKPILYNLGYPVADGEFKPAKEANLQEVKDQLSIIKQVKDLGEPVDADHIYDVSGVPKPADYDAQKAQQEEQRKKALEMQNPKPPKNKPAQKQKLYDDEGFWNKLRHNIADFFAPAR